MIIGELQNKMPRIKANQEIEITLKVKTNKKITITTRSSRKAQFMILLSRITLELFGIQLCSKCLLLSERAAKAHHF